MKDKNGDRHTVDPEHESFKVAHSKMTQLLAKGRPLEAQNRAELHGIIQGLVEDAMRSESGKERLLSVKGDEAVTIMDWLHNVS